VFFVDRKVFPLTGKCFPLTGKCFPLTNFSNGKQTQESLESGFPESEFRETNMAQIAFYFPLSFSTWQTLDTYNCHIVSLMEDVKKYRVILFYYLLRV